MAIQLDATEARILGSLIEKALTTPDQYPLTFHALLTSCNQKTSRDPVMELEPDGLENGIRALEAKRLAERINAPGSRVPKFRHHVENLLPLISAQETGALCVLLLRGPQTPGELKARTDRLCRFESTAEIESLLQGLAARAEGPVVARLPRQPGQKETRYRHLFSGAAAPPPAAPAPAPASSLEKRLEELERRVKTLEERLG